MNELRFANRTHTFVMTHDTSIVFICMGNICRSPTAEGVFRHMARTAGLIERIAIDSDGRTTITPASRRMRGRSVMRCGTAMTFRVCVRERFPGQTLNASTG